jgi:hypothetical protein
MSDPLTQEVRALQRLNLQELRDLWRVSFGPPPKLRSADLLRWNLAWRMQAAAHGGLDAWTRRALQQKGAAAPEVPAGVRLAREWQGARHEVEVLEGGKVAYRGRIYASLSQVARAITGSRWNGPRFFGLRVANAS